MHRDDLKVLAPQWLNYTHIMRDDMEVGGWGDTQGWKNTGCQRCTVGTSMQSASGVVGTVFLRKTCSGANRVKMINVFKQVAASITPPQQPTHLYLTARGI